MSFIYAGREDFHKVALRARKSPYPMLPVEEAMRIIMDHTSVLPSIELPLHGTAGAYSVHKEHFGANMY